MRNEKGLTLIEVLAAVSILSLVIIGFSYLFTKNYEFSFKEEKRDAAVNIARTVIEEFKIQLPTTNSSATIFNQPVPLAAFRDNPTVATTATIKYPSATDAKYTVVIKKIPIPSDKKITIQKPGVTGQSFEFNYSEFFTQIEVQVTNNAMNTNYTIQTYVERKGLGS